MSVGSPWSSGEIAPKVTLCVIEAPEVARARRAGQFVIIRVSEGGERIPLTLADAERGTVTWVVQEVGTTTSKLARLPVGESLASLVGTLGGGVRRRSSASRGAGWGR